MALCAYWHKVGIIVQSRSRGPEAPLEVGVVGSSWEVDLFQYPWDSVVVCVMVCVVDKNIMLP